VAEELGEGPAFVFIQDYHFALLSRMLKERCPNLITAQFWHIPWPNPEVFRIFPWQEEILEGLLGNDILGFHLRYHCMNFLDTVARVLEARIDTELMAVVYREASTKVRSFPISVDLEAIEEAAQSAEVQTEMVRLRERFALKTDFLAVGVDRLDYTKGIPERFRALDRFLDKYPEYQGRFVFFQAGVSTRTHISQYQQAQQEMELLAEAINRKYQRDGWRPIVFAREHFSPASLYALYQMADACIVSSLHDGMNLVAKEYVSARTDEGGALILSPFTGAARELTEALLVNPYAADAFAETIRQALEMDPAEGRLRMRHLRQTVARNNVYRWATSVVEKLSEQAEEVAGHASLVETLAAPLVRA
jgi:trehalose 6-phosphate synthase